MNIEEYIENVKEKSIRSAITAVDRMAGDDGLFVPEQVAMMKEAAERDALANLDASRMSGHRVNEGILSESRLNDLRRLEKEEIDIIITSGSEQGRVIAIDEEASPVGVGNMRAVIRGLSGIMPGSSFVVVHNHPNSVAAFPSKIDENMFVLIGYLARMLQLKHEDEIIVCMFDAYCLSQDGERSEWLDGVLAPEVIIESGKLDGRLAGLLMGGFGVSVNHLTRRERQKERAGYPKVGVPTGYDFHE